MATLLNPFTSFLPATSRDRTIPDRPSTLLRRTFGQNAVSSRAGRRASAPPEAVASPPHRGLTVSAGENAALLARVAASDADAFERLYDNLSAPMYSLVVRIVGSRADAEDVLQIGFHQVWRCAKDYRGELGSPFSWIATIMRRKAIDRLRSRLGHFQRIYAAFQGRVEEQENRAGDADLLASERQAAVRGALFRLNREERSAIRLAFFDGLTHVEIAQILGVPAGTVKARIRRGMQKLRCAMSDLPEAPVGGMDRA